MLQGCTIDREFAEEMVRVAPLGEGDVVAVIAFSKMQLGAGRLLPAPGHRLGVVLRLTARELARGLGLTSLEPIG